jgi:VCBS repeat-containing protein
MKKVIAYCLIILFSLTFVFNAALAASLGLTNIGGLATDGAKYSEWYYTQTNPLLKGTAQENSTVSVSVDGSASTVTADASGNWSYQMQKGQGDYAVVLSQGSETYSFTLHLGQNVPGAGAAAPTKTTTTSPVPVTGYNHIVGLTLGLGVILFGSYLYIWGDSSRNLTVKRRDIEE